MNTILIIIMLVGFFGYLAYVWIKYGIRDSVSATWYDLKDPEKILFTLMCWSIAFPFLIFAGIQIEHTHSIGMILAFLGGVGIVFTGAAPNYRFKVGSSKTEYHVHTIGSMGGIIAAIVSLWVAFGLWWLTAAMAAFYGLTYVIKIKNATTWVEVAAAVAIIISMIVI